MPGEETGKVAIVAISRPGAVLACRLQSRMAEAALFLPERHGAGSPGARAWSGSSGDLLRDLFGSVSGLVVFGSVGMVVRLIAPLVRDKRCDPAVVVVDDAGRFAVSVLSGHLGGANALARRVGALLGAQPVVTTASDVLDTLAVDLLGRELGWRMEHAENVTRASAALVNGETVGLLQEAGELEWWPPEKPLPPNLVRCASRRELAALSCAAALVVSDRLVPADEDVWRRAVLYRPRSLVVGVGCNRGTPAGEIGAAIGALFEREGLALASVRNLATVDLKRDEAGLSALAAAWGVPVAFFAGEELAAVAGVANPSPMVAHWVGTPSVCEAAALRSSGAASLLVPKRKSPGVTVAVARVDFGPQTGGSSGS